jgi:hypothetical protein
MHTYLTPIKGKFDDPHTASFFLILFFQYSFHYSASCASSMRNCLSVLNANLLKIEVRYVMFWTHGITDPFASTKDIMQGSSWNETSTAETLADGIKRSNRLHRHRGNRFTFQ